MGIFLGNLMGGVASVLGLILNLALIIVIVDAVLSWVNPDPNNPIVRFLRSATQPLVDPIRKRIKTNFGPLDLAPMILIIGIIFLQSVLVTSLNDFGVQMKMKSMHQQVPTF